MDRKTKIRLLIGLVLVTVIVTSAAGYFDWSRHWFLPSLTKHSNNQLPTNQFNGSESLTKTTTGVVTGRLCYPSDILPKGEIVAKDIETGKIFTQNYSGTPRGKTTYAFELSPGSYHLRYDATISDKPLPIYYTDFSKCGIEYEPACSQKPHHLLSVKVEPGKTIANVDLCDSDFFRVDQQNF